MRLIAACLGLLLVSLAPAARLHAQDTSPVTHVQQGDLRGALLSVAVPEADGSTRRVAEKVYEGIPYAAPPVGDLRWKAPSPAQGWNTARDATSFGHTCMQQPQAWMTPEMAPAEDCLTLNIWTPADPQGKLPVYVYIHGGNYVYGAGSNPDNTGELLAARGMVVVTLNYRLGIFGWMAHPQLTAESPVHASGNYGLMDQIAALKWVRQNIAAFGGDPSRITVGGESAGATSTAYLLVSPMAKGLFDRAIIESPSRLYDALIFRTTSMNPAPPKQNANAPAQNAPRPGSAESEDAKTITAPATPEPAGFVPSGAGPLTSGQPNAQNPPYITAEEIGLAMGPDIAQLRAMSAGQLFQHAQQVNAQLFSRERDPYGNFIGRLLPLSPYAWVHTGQPDTGWAIIIDGAVVPAPIGTAIKAGCLNGVPILIGTNADEGTQPVLNLQIKTEQQFRHYLNTWFAPVYAGVRGAYGGQSVAQWKDSIAALVRDAFFDYGANRLAADATGNGQHVFLYHFTRVAPKNAADKLGAFHSAELPYLFHGAEGEGYDDTDRKLAIAMQKAWLSFIASGDPNPDRKLASKTPLDISDTGQTELWPLWSASYPRMMQLGDDVRQAYVLNNVVFSLFDRDFARYQKVVPAANCSQ